jgi:hypothetical protein
MKISRKLDINKNIDFIEKLNNHSGYAIVSKNELFKVDYIKRKTRGIYKHSRNILNLKVTKGIKILIHIKTNNENLIKMFDPRKWTKRDIYSWPSVENYDFDKMDYSSTSD